MGEGGEIAIAVVFLVMYIIMVILHLFFMWSIHASNAKTADELLQALAIMQRVRPQSSRSKL